MFSYIRQLPDIFYFAYLLGLPASRWPLLIIGNASGSRHDDANDSDAYRITGNLTAVSS